MYAAYAADDATVTYRLWKRNGSDEPAQALRVASLMSNIAKDMASTRKRFDEFSDSLKWVEDTVKVGHGL